MNRTGELITEIRVNGYGNGFVHNPIPPRSRHAGKWQIFRDFRKNMVTPTGGVAYKKYNADSIA